MNRKPFPARKPLKKTIGSKAEQRKPGERQRITHAEARRRAERHVLKRTFEGATVQDGAAVRLGIYYRGDWTEKDVWVVYENSEEMALKSSKVVLVCKRTGRVLYEGPTNDEG
jgi:hypothetical protein